MSPIPPNHLSDVYNILPSEERSLFMMRILIMQNVFILKLMGGDRDI